MTKTKSSKPLNPSNPKFAENTKPNSKGFSGHILEKMKE
jgi:hypothetical protein